MQDSKGREIAIDDWVKFVGGQESLIGRVFEFWNATLAHVVTITPQHGVLGRNLAGHELTLVMRADGSEPGPGRVSAAGA